MRILVTNDDGIRSEYLAMLAEAAKALGEVTVIAPSQQCSAMSHRITLYRPMEFHPVEDFPVEGVRAYRIDATPASLCSPGSMTGQTADTTSCTRLPSGQPWRRSCIMFPRSASPREGEAAILS